MNVPANPLVAQRVDSTTWFSGIGIAETVDMIVTGVENCSWIDGALGGVGTVAETAVWVLDPVGALVTAGFGWCVEHVEPLSQALDWLAGDPDQIAANAQTWHNVAVEHANIADRYNRAIAGQVTDWQGPAADAYRQQAGQTLDLLSGLTRAAEGMKAIVAMSGSLVTFVRTLVRDLIGELVSILLARLPLWTAETVGTLGIAAPYVVAQVTALVAKWGARITRLVKALTSSLRNLMPALRGLDEAIEAINALLRRRSGVPAGAITDPASPEIRWGGAGYVDDPQTPLTGRQYEQIRARTDDVDNIAELLGVPRHVVERVKQHLFLTTHDVPVKGKMEHGFFAPMKHIGDWWTKAADDALPWSSEIKLKRLLVHEYVESHLMELGMPYRDPRAPVDFVDKNLIGAHDLAPYEDALFGMFSHWPALGRTPPDIALAGDLSNIDEILQAVLREMP